MKLVELRVLKEDTVYKKVLDKLKLKGLNELELPNKDTETIDYLEIIMKVIDFVQQNKKVLKKLTPEQQEDIIVIIIDEMLEKMGIDVNEEQIEKVLLLLKNSLLVQNVINYLIRKTKKLFRSSCTTCTSS